VYDDRDHVLVHWQEKRPGWVSDRLSAVAYSCGLSPIASAVSRRGLLFRQPGCFNAAPLVKVAAPPMLTEQPSGERAGRDSSAQLAVAPPAFPSPKRARNMEVPTWALRNKLQFGKIAPKRTLRP